MIMDLENDYNALMNSCKMLQTVQREQQNTINTLHQLIRNQNNTMKKLKTILDEVLSTCKNCDKIEFFKTKGNFNNE